MRDRLRIYNYTRISKDLNGVTHGDLEQMFENQVWFFRLKKLSAGDEGFTLSLRSWA